MTALLEVRDLSRRFGGVTAVDRVSFDVASDDAVAVIGPNGAGKTTLLNLISGLDRPDAGHVRLEGADITGRPPWRLVNVGLGRTQQAPGLFASLSVHANLSVVVPAGTRSPGVIASMLHLPSARQAAAAASERAAEIIELLGLEADAHRPAGELPFGTQRLVEIGRALAARPRILLLDEPAAGLGGKEVADLVGLLRELPATGMSVVVVEHNMQVVMNVAKRIVVLNFGGVLFEGSPAEVRNHPEVIAAYLGSAGTRGEVGRAAG